MILVRSVPIALGIAFIASGCTTVDVSLIARVKTEDLRKFDEPNHGFRSIEVGKIVVQMPEGKPYGRYGQGPGCTLYGSVLRATGPAQVTLGGPFFNTVSKTLTSSGLRVVGNPTALFVNPESQGDLVLAARVVDVDFATCGDMIIGWRFASYISVEWELFSRQQQGVVFKATTQGSAANERRTYDEKTPILDLALESATKNLLALDEFRTLVGTK